MMTPLTDRELLAYAARALDPGTARAVEDALAVDPEARRRLATLELDMDRLRGINRWHLPLVPLPDHQPALAVEVVREMAFGAAERGGLLPGDHIGLRVAAPGDARGWMPIVVRESQGRSEVIYPTLPEEWVTLDHWPLKRGAHEVDVVIDAPPGDHRYLVILAAAPPSVDWSAEPDGRWAAVRAEVEEGRLPAAFVRIHVDAAP